MPPVTKRQINPLVYDTTRWQEMLFQKRITGDLSSVLAVTAQSLTVANQEGQKAHSLGLEIFSRLYDEPEKMETPEPSAPWAPKIHEILGEMEEFKNLSALTVADPDMAAIATADLLKVIAPKLQAMIKEVEKKSKAQAQPVQPGQPGQGQPGAPGDGFGRPGFELTEEDKIRAALRGACRDARQGIQEAKTLMEGIAPGYGDAPATHDQEDPKRMLLAKAMHSSKDLRQIIDLAGRLERISQKTKKRRSKDSYEEVVDIERGADLGRILPSELAGLRGQRVVRLLTLKKIADRTALQYRLEGHEPLGRGEMIVALDESGSMGMMQNNIIPNTWARAVGLACLRVALQDKRAVTILGFNGRITAIHKMEKDGSCFRIHGQKIEAIAGGFPVMALEVISRGCGGGTSFDAPIKYAVEQLKGAERPDLVFVTDGEATVSPAIMDALAEGKKKDLRVFGIAMGHGSITDVLKSVCDFAIDFRPDVERISKVIPG